MSIVIRKYAEEHVKAVRQFNDRLRGGGEPSQFPLSPTPRWLPKIAGRKLYQEYYLAIDDAGDVRGAYILKHQNFWIKDQVVAIADYHGPISEGAVNRNYPQVGVQLLWDALHKQPLLFGLGMGGYDEPLARMLTAAGWSMFSVPLFFHIVYPAAFLRNIAHLRRRPARRCVLDILAATGLGWLGIRTMQAICVRKAPLDPTVTVETVDEFSDWVDEIWQRAKGEYGMTAVRDAETLRILYPRRTEKFIRLKISNRAQPIGWAVLLDTRCSDHKHFGDMRLGSIVDGFSATADAPKVIGAARRFLESQGVDLIVSNQSHAAWRQGLRRAGFFEGPTNFIFTASRKLAEQLRRHGIANDDLHLNRGDGDGPIHL